ncbi:uncharacterized protein LOC143294538 isoform X2 [Babylonia areolata]|uniref:uncharacterized protein LOC143294538 isoform X2 n=1 Tax=Babylonia areolata TaxID=304850 RepID=UPI003FD42252
MDEIDDSADEEAWRPKPYSEAPKEIVWSVGDECQARWSGDNKLYRGVVRKLRHTDTGRAVALVQFVDYEDDECEEVDVQQLQQVEKARDECSEEKAKGRDRPDENDTTCGSGFFRPLTGIEDISRLEDKYGHESDSDYEERSGSSKRTSSTPYGTKGKVSEWKVRSPVKASASVSQRHKSPVVQVRSPRKRGSAARRKTDTVQTEKKNDRTATSNASVDTTLAASTSPLRQSLDRDIKDGPGPSGATRHGADDSAFGLTCEDGLFEGFDEDDMEKPKFTFPAPSEKVPFSLDDAQNVQIPAPLNQYLRDYQREGVQFLYSHYQHNRGAILGDDMGLGKTVQVIGFLCALMGKQGNRQDVLRQKPRFIRLMSDTPDVGEKGPSGPVLIIGPGSVLYNWLEELETWAYFTVRKYHGADKASCLTDVGRGKVEVVVTTFETCRDNVDALNKVKWDAVIVDEVHRIKGLKAQTTKALRKLKCRRRYGLTGTALQNSMSELWCILDWAQPNVLGSAEDFEEDFVRPIELGQKRDATKRELAVARRKKEEFATVRSQMMLRRTKKLIAHQLPVKTDRVVFCRLVPLQISVYKAVLSHPDLKMVLGLNEECVCGSGLTFGRCCYKKQKSARSPKSVMFTFMHVLLKASNHIALLTPHGRMSPDQARQARRLCAVAFRDHPEFLELAREAAFRTLSDPKYCGKMKVLHGMLSVFAKDHSKVLIFSYSTRLLDILEQHVMSEGLDYRRIDGTVNGRRRQEIVREFNTNPDIFLCLVSTKAGGLGLNMTGANKVVIFDPNWNPSHDLQAQDRAYRIGQRRDVEVYRLISAGSIEENIYLRQIYKQQLDNVVVGTENARRYFHGVQGDAENQGELFGIRNMFRLRTGDSCLTMDILSRNAKMEAGIAGHDMADYIPSWREQQGTEDSSTVDDSDDDDGRRKLDEGSSDEETLNAFKDLFDEVSDEEESKKQPATPKTPAKISQPTPSTSGLHTARRSAQPPAKPLHRSSDSESEKSARSSKPTTRQRKLRVGISDGGGGGGWFEETSATEALSFLEEGDVRASKKGKAPTAPQRRDKERGVGVGVKGSKVVPPVDDSLVTPSFSSVSSVFEQYGVVHVHNHPQVVGASRVEDHVTRCAMHDVFELSTNTQAPAALCDPMSQPGEEEPPETSKLPASSRKGQKGRAAGKRNVSKDHNSARTVDHGRWHVLVGQTPSAIRKKHWGQLKEVAKCQDAITLAQRVLVASPEERLAMLRELYRCRHDDGLHPTLDSILTKPEELPVKALVRKTAARTPTVGNQTRAGKKKTSQTKPAAGKKPAVRRKRRAPGLLYTDEDDTQLSQAPRTSAIDLEDESGGEDSMYDVGDMVSPAKVKAVRNRRRAVGGSTRGRQTQQSVVSPSLFSRSEEHSQHQGVASWKDTDRLAEPAGSLETEDMDGLLSELGRHPADAETRLGLREADLTKSDAASTGCRKQNVDDSNQTAVTVRQRSKLSVLDDIFCEPEDCQLKKRKPPPSRGCSKPKDTAQRTNTAGILGDVAEASSMSGLRAETESRGQQETELHKLLRNLL